ETQADGRSQAHAAPRVEVPRPIAGRIQIVGGMTEARDNRRVAGELNDDASRLDPVHDPVVTFRGSRHARLVRGPKAVFPPQRMVSHASLADETVVCGTPSDSKMPRTARPIGICAAFQSPLSPRMLTTISTGI